jgi:allophanate hydrolase subunit 2
LGVIPGYQYERFSAVERMKFFSGTYQVSTNIDRMGYRLQGEPINSGSSGIISEGIALGAVQIPADGQPIILLRDRQTIGGYPKIGCVFSLDLARLAQRKPGGRVEFTLLDLAAAENRRVLYDHQFTE